MKPKRNDVMMFVNQELKSKAATIETRIVNAICDNNEGDIVLLMVEVETLLQTDYITENDYNVLTDIETLKEIYS